jgi:hypothetical protein
MEADREARFGVILSRSVSPTSDHREPAIGNISPKKSNRSFYQLPNAAVSEPMLPSKSFETVLAMGKRHGPHLLFLKHLYLRLTAVTLYLDGHPLLTLEQQWRCLQEARVQYHYRFSLRKD